MSGGRAWTTGEVRRLHQLRARRLTAEQIGRELNRSVDAIYSFLRYVPATRECKAGMKPTERLGPQWGEGEIEQMRRMASDGANAREIAAELNRSMRSVACKASEEKISFTKRCGDSSYRLEREGYHYARNAVEGSSKLLEALRGAQLG